MTDTVLEYHAVAKTSEVDDDEVIAVSVGRQDIGIYKLAGEIYALSDICTHAYAAMSDGYVEMARSNARFTAPVSISRPARP